MLDAGTLEVRFEQLGGVADFSSRFTNSLDFHS